MQAIASFAASLLLARLILPSYGIPGSYSVLALLTILVALTSFLIPPNYEIQRHGNSSGRLPFAGAVSLVSVVAYLGGVSAFWVYLSPLALEFGYDSLFVGTAISMAIGAQILGGLAAIALAGKVRGITSVLLAALASLTLVLTVLFVPNQWVFAGAAAGFAFLWMFAPPFQLPFLLEVDPTHRAAMFVSPAQLLGVAIGPIIASRTVSELHFAGAGYTSASLFTLAFSLTLLAKLYLTLQSRKQLQKHNQNE
jgi:predicted MFS family arabinose efflux permease